MMYLAVYHTLLIALWLGIWYARKEIGPAERPYDPLKMVFGVLAALPLFVLLGN